ncbi:glutamate receptor ionotropic, delta-2-like [Portunus trituberculatus]|uniref:glutamate receptor ionotropic, delta-2-like n=1 Tax=Portunus trituberculatus TaxID=210409 RepID=UPI001E1D144C|nr:glutamate receptor ionotropic, delta-2-like [Portunus trituberculatus]
MGTNKTLVMSSENENDLGDVVSSGLRLRKPCTEDKNKPNRRIILCLCVPRRRFGSSPTLTVAIEVLPHNRISWVEDPDAPGGRRLLYSGYVDNIVRHFAKALNFTPLYALSPERTFGTRLSDGSWTGLIGMVVRQEADFAPGPFIISPVRREAVDHSTILRNGNLRILSGLSRLTIDPWGFLLPLTPLVWAVTLAALLGVLFVLQLFPSCLPDRSLLRGGWSANTFSPVRVLLQQDVVWPAQWWLWERLVLGLWMLTTLVLTKSYSGNLMSLLAVKYLPQPFQTLRDILDHPHVAMIGQKHSNFEQNLRDVESGLFKEVASLEDEGRLEFHTQSQYLKSLDNLVRRGHHVLVDVDLNLKSLIGLDFSREGQCDFYISRDGFIPYSAVMIFQKTSPLTHSFNKRLRSAIEQGLISYWMENVPNFTECENVPKKMLVTSHISLSNIWGVFAVLAASLVAGILVLVVEMAAAPAK